MLHNILLVTTLLQHTLAITTPSGLTIQGKSTSSCHEYLSIPFAAPPINSLRWKPPAKYTVKPGGETINGTQYPPLCMQPSNGWSSLDSSKMSEDCLYLNIFTPKTYEPQSLPVLVYIHGGDYMYGGTNDEELNGCNMLSVTNDVIVVTIQYRLGIFGFLGSDAMRSRDETTGSTGNYGLQDQIEALRWIQSNIGVFGGDNSNILIFGESAGAGSITNLLVVESAQSLYHRAVLQSGAFAAWSTKTLENATELYNDVVSQTCDTKDVTAAEIMSCLLDVSASDLTEVMLELTAYPDQWTVCRWAPTIDGVLIKIHPQDTVLNNPTLINNIPLMYGNNDEEGISFLSATQLSSSASINPSTFTTQNYLDWLKLNFPIHDTKIAKTYDALLKQPGDNRPYYVAQRIVGDFMLFCPGRRSARALSAVKNRQNVYEYMFDRARNEIDGAYHGAEVSYVFAASVPGTAEEWELAQSMAWMWSMFGKYGNPTPSTTEVLKDPPSMLKDITWKTWPNYIELDTTTGGGLENKINLRVEVCDVWDTIHIVTQPKRAKSGGSGSGTYWNKTTIAVGIGITFTMIGLVIVCGLMFKFYLTRNGNASNGGGFVSMTDDDGDDGDGDDNCTNNGNKNDDGGEIRSVTLTAVEDHPQDVA